MRRRRLAFAAAAACLLALALTGCAPSDPCPRLSSNPDGSYTIAEPNPQHDVTGCEYEFDEDENLGTERDTDG